MTDLTKIEKPYGLCTQEEQNGLDALKTFPCSLQTFYHNSGWGVLLIPKPSASLSRAVTYRQNPDWQAPTLDVPDWFWESTEYNYLAMDRSGEFHAYKSKPEKATAGFWAARSPLGALDLIGFTCEFNPHNVPWDKSLTVRPGLEE